MCDIVICFNCSDVSTFKWCSFFLWYEYVCCIFPRLFYFGGRDFDRGSGGSSKDHLVFNTCEMYGLQPPAKLR